MILATKRSLQPRLLGSTSAEPTARWAIFLAPALLAALLPLSTEAATLSVGPGQAYRTVASAVAAARDGDVVQVQAGTYTNDFPVVTRNISIVGVGGMARLVANTAIPNGKGILITRANVTVQSIELAGAQVADRNGAADRQPAGRLVSGNGAQQRAGGTACAG